MQSAHVGRPAQFHRPRVAQIVASVLRDRILSGELPDGGALPKQEDLLEEFNVSLPSLREALSILETEGLATVQRGNVGGAVVHAPTPAQPSYMAALVMQAQSVTLDDLVEALRKLDPLCAALCAERRDRRRTVLPVLRQNLKRGRALLDNPNEYVRVARAFHEGLVTLCGNQSIILMVGALDTIWAAHDEQLAVRTEKFGPAAERTARERSLKEHQAIFDAIEAGDPRAAEAASRGHYEGRGSHALLDRGLVVRAAMLRENDVTGRRGSADKMSHSHRAPAV
jgi:DNA-binding FadR family transcriptional regulator